MGDGISDGPKDYGDTFSITDDHGSPKVERVNEFDEMMKDVAALMSADIQDQIKKIRSFFPRKES